MAEPVTRTKLWSQEVAEADPAPEVKPTYEFSGGRKFYEQGTGNAQPIDPKTNE
jgi:hypothetical protein